MIVTVRHITDFLDYWASPSIKLSYDNVGLQAGDANTILTGVLTTLDVTEAVIDEAIAKKTNLIVAHHPLIFPTISSLTASHPVGKLLIKLIKNDIALYVSHTNLDSVKDGVSFVLAEKFGLEKCEFLAKGEGKLVRFEGSYHASKKQKMDEFLRANASFIVQSTAAKNEYDYQFSIVSDAVYQQQLEKNLQLLSSVPVLKSLVDAVNTHYGLGAVGELGGKKGLTKAEFLELVCERLQISSFRFTGSRETIKRVAVCGGSGSSFIKDAIRAKADAYITADIKYHDYFIPQSDLLVFDIGHFETERFIAETLKNRIKKAFPDLEVLQSAVHTNPMQVYTSQKETNNTLINS